MQSTAKICAEIRATREGRLFFSLLIKEIVLWRCCSPGRQLSVAFEIGKISTSITGQKLCKQRDGIGAHPFRNKALFTSR